MRAPAFVAAIGLLAAATASAEALALRWRAPETAVRAFVIERRLAGAAEFSPLARVEAHARGFVDGSVPPGTRACYRVRAERPDGNVSRSGELCGTAPPALGIANGETSANASRWRGEAGNFLRLDEPAREAPAPPQPAQPPDNED